MTASSDTFGTEKHPHRLSIKTSEENEDNSLPIEQGEII